VPSRSPPLLIRRAIGRSGALSKCGEEESAQRLVQGGGFDLRRTRGEVCARPWHSCARAWGRPACVFVFSGESIPTQGERDGAGRAQNVDVSMRLVGRC